MTNRSEKILLLTFWKEWKRMVTFLTAFALVMKQLFMCLESLTNIMQEFGELKTHTLLWKSNVTVQRLMCGEDFCVAKLLDHFSLNPIAWPPRSPDITPLDFFLWGYVKDVVYRTKVKDISDLKERITAAVEAIDEEMLKRTWTEIEYRLDILRATNGAYIEIY